MSMGFTDIHTHLLWGMDDGAQRFEETCAMIERAVNQGVTTIAATPHSEPGVHRFNRERYEQHLQQVRAWCAQRGIPIRLVSGSELLYTHAAARMAGSGEIPTLGNSGRVLVEFSQDVKEAVLRRAAREFAAEGLDVVFAHVERYRAMRSISFMQELHDEGHVVMQCNLSLFLERCGPLTALWRKRAMERGLIDAVASDAHNTTTRPCRFAEGTGAIADLFGEEEAARLAVINPRRILTGDELVR